MRIEHQTAMVFGACAAMGIGALLIAFSTASTASEFWSLFLEGCEINNFMRIALSSGISVVALALIGVSNLPSLPTIAFLLSVMATLISIGLITMPFALWSLGASTYWIYRRNTQPIT